MTEHIDPRTSAAIAQAVGDPVYLVWSNKQHAWWGPKGRHYTQDVWQAGRYTQQDAGLACQMRTWEPGKQPPEVAVRAPESGRESLTIDEVRMAETFTRRLAEEITRKAMSDRDREAVA